MKTPYNPKQHNQAAILVVAAYLGIYGPYSESNRSIYKKLGGHYDGTGGRWLVPDTAANRAVIEGMFGSPGPSVIAELPDTCLDVDGQRLAHGGYVVATWHTTHKRVNLLPGVELAAGSWDLAASEAKGAPCFSGPGAILNVVLRQDYALRHGLKVVEELGEETAVNPLTPYADSDLRAELEARGYRVRPVSAF